MNVAMMEQTRELNRGLVRWLVAGAAAVALFIVLLLHSAPVGAAAPDGDAVWCNGGFTTYCPNAVGLWNGWQGWNGWNGNWNGNWYANGWYANGWFNNANTGFQYRTYTDNRGTNCPNNQVTQVGFQFFCTQGGYGAVSTNTGTNVFPFAYGNYGFGYTGFNPWLYNGWNGWNGWNGVYTGVVRVAETAAPVAAPVAAPEPAPAPAPVAAPVQVSAAPAAPVVTQPVAAPQPAPAQVVTSLSAAQQPAAPQAPVAAPLSVPTSGSGNGTHVQGTVTAPVAAPAVDPGNDDHRG